MRRRECCKADSTLPTPTTQPRRIAKASDAVIALIQVSRIKFKARNAALLVLLMYKCYAPEATPVARLPQISIHSLRESETSWDIIDP